MNNTVMVRACEDYDPEKIEAIVTDGMHQLGCTPSGKVFAKPNVVVAYQTDKLGRHAFTPPSFVGAGLKAISHVPGVKRIDVGENVAIGTPTRLGYDHAGYYDEIKKVRRTAGCPVDIFCIDEELRDTRFVGGVVHDTLRVARRMARADTKIYFPKLKCHCVSKMTGAVKLNIGICSDDERAIRHDFMLNEKIVDLLTVGMPDFIVMDAIDVGMGNEGFPTVRKLGLVLMGTNPLAVDMVAARLLGYALEDVPYLALAVARGYCPASLDDITIAGDLGSLEEIDEHAQRILPYDEEYTRWQDVSKELKRMNSPMRFVWGPYAAHKDDKCLTGCVMGVKMFLGLMERYAGAQAFADAEPVVFVIGRPAKTVDANGAEVFMFGSCAQADIVNAKKVIHIDKCFTTATDMIIKVSHRMGMKSPFRDPSFLIPFGKAVLAAAFRKCVSLRYLQDMVYFVTRGLLRKI
jgi:uncharacterized protein (DUF362 family)